MLPSTRCSFALTSDQSMVSQAVYCCKTCGLCEEQQKGLCEGCVQTCHQTHETLFLGYGRAYCDCGAGGCALSLESLDAAKDALCMNSSNRYESLLANHLYTNLPNLTSPHQWIHSNSISQDEDGRLLGTKTSGLQIHNFHAVQLMSFIDEKNLNEICNLNESDMYETLVRQSTTLASHSKETFWMAAGSDEQDQLSVLEHLALAIFHAHVGDGVVFDTNNSGAEWWVQVKRTGDSTTVQSSTMEFESSTAAKIEAGAEVRAGTLAGKALSTIGEMFSQSNPQSSPQSNPPSKFFATGGVDLHYDKDEVLAESFSVGVFPQISTVIPPPPPLLPSPRVPFTLIQILEYTPSSLMLVHIITHIPHPHTLHTPTSCALSHLLTFSPIPSRILLHPLLLYLLVYLISVGYLSLSKHLCCPNDRL